MFHARQENVPNHNVRGDSTNKGSKTEPKTKTGEIIFLSKNFFVRIEMKKFTLKGMRENENMRMRATNIKPKFIEIFNVPGTITSTNLRERMRRFRMKANFGTNYKEIQKKRATNPGVKIKDSEAIEWTWPLFEELMEEKENEECKF